MFDFDRDEYLATKLPLRFRQDGRFRLLILTDPHGGEGMNEQLFSAVDAVVEHAKPDLVLFGGDITGCHIGCRTLDSLRAYMTRLTRVIEENGIPWAHVFGNHDDNIGVPLERQEALFESFPHCVSKAGDRRLARQGNYVLPILASRSDEPVFNIWAMDTHNDNRDFARRFGLDEESRFILPEHFAMGYHSDSVYTDQLIWYYETSLAIEHAFKRKVPGLLVEHIPLPEFCLIARNPQQTHMTGVMREHVGTNELNPGLFSAIVQRGDIKAVFAGHDHLNDYCGTYLGVTLGACAGINYDAGSHDDLRGGRLVDLCEGDPAHIVTSMLRVRDALGEAGDNQRERSAI